MLCLANNIPTLSTRCKMAFMSLSQQMSPGGKGGTGAGTQPMMPESARVRATQIKACMPGLMRACQPQMMELIGTSTFLGADPAALETCATAHSETIGGDCEKIVGQIASNGMLEELTSCGQKFLGLCPAEAFALVGAETGNQAVWTKVRPLIKCLKSKKDEVHDTCEVIFDELIQDDEDEDPDAEDWDHWDDED